ncbi:DUF721 domain-containing protein [Zhihengliuella salsuginis]|uniref:DUF721 domain-containing protein n=1 Tax=Zhihengliuella salsuginis TaxID=578222 RepID=A0ABQ3GM49_9MICC|nr:DciA family protein [Zhihengliuella salsuginis]GHD11323.1 hypothetical protein GCM10008096_25850 [Zhihengliuella salsuginis]
MNRDRDSAGSQLRASTTPEPQFDAAHAMLNRMRLIAESRGEARIDAKRAAAIADRQASAKARRAKRTESAMYDNGRDPLGVGAVMDRLVRNRGWTSPVAVGSVLSEWDALVGPQISAHCRPESFEATTVVVRCDSSSWATQLRLLSHNLLKTFDEKLGHGVVTTIQVLGPQAPSWRRGMRTVEGRGPRDTYG